MFDRSKLDLAVATFTVAGRTLMQEIENVKAWSENHGTVDDDDAWELCLANVHCGVEAVSLEELPDIPAPKTEEPEEITS